MNMPDLIELASNKLMRLNEAMTTATSQGNAAEVVRIDSEVAETQRTLDALKAL